MNIFTKLETKKSFMSLSSFKEESEEKYYDFERKKKSSILFFFISFRRIN